MRVVGEILVDMAPVNAIIARHGLNVGGDVQRFHTANVRRRIQKYMPFRTGTTINLMVIRSPVDEPFIHVDTPYARVLYHGWLMVDPETGAAGFMTPNGWRSRRGVAKVVSDRPITYTKSKNPQAGPYWDRALKANEMRQMQQDLQDYVKRRKVK